MWSGSCSCSGCSRIEFLSKREMELLGLQRKGVLSCQCLREGAIRIHLEDIKLMGNQTTTILITTLSQQIDFLISLLKTIRSLILESSESHLHSRFTKSISKNPLHSSQRPTHRSTLAANPRTPQSALKAK